MDRYCASCQWYDLERHMCLSDDSGVFLTGDSDTCHYWENYDYGMHGGEDDG